ADLRGHGWPLHHQRLDRAAEAFGERTLHGDVERGENALDIAAVPRKEHLFDEAVGAAALDQRLAIPLTELVPTESDQSEARRRKASRDDARRGEKRVMALEAEAMRSAWRLRPAHGGIEVRHESDQRRVGRNAELTAKRLGIDGGRIEILSGRAVVSRGDPFRGDAEVPIQRRSVLAAADDEIIGPAG